jgi:type I restriction enzyme M protein
MTINILKYESEVWKTADLLIGAGIKQSDFPKYMMPFFALLMVESRLIREADRLEKEVGRADIDDFIEMFSLEGLGYNDFVIRHKKTLKTICQNDKTFDVDFHSYLKAFDGETKYLLGVDKGTEEEKFLDISGIAGQLKKKRILFDTVKAWSEIDLTPFNNSEITTLEEHIKRKWADISAETAGEQYTPDDIIALISEIIATKIENNSKFLTLYDPTCGGGNLLFGTEDKIQEIYPNRPTATYGQEWNGTLYALAKIESRFRKDTQIEYGNTLTDIGKFWDKTFNVIVANPPYGVDWKGYEKDIKNDTTERFVALPSISDGQFLFTQHILHKLADDGLSIVVHNGSTLFSGDAGSGESNIRKHFFEQDWVEAIIQMPTDEFFNTGIYTYLWIFNKNKAADRKDKVILINASELFIPLKKSKGKKRKEMDLPNRTKIVQTLTDFKDCYTEQGRSIAKVFDKWHFYYNKQSIMLTNIDDEGKALIINDKLLIVNEEKEKKSLKLKPVKIIQYDETGKSEITDFEITEENVITSDFADLNDYFENYIKPLIANLDYKEKALFVQTADSIFTYDKNSESIATIKKLPTSINNSQLTINNYLGCGKIVIKASLKKDSKTKQPKSINITAELTQDLQKDYEIIPYNPDEAINNKTIADFIAKYVFKPFEYLDNVIGVEVNFNKVFYIPLKLNEVTTITTALDHLDKELTNLENDLKL